MYNTLKFAAFSALLIFIPPAFATSSSAKGKVVDPLGAVIPNARIIFVPETEKGQNDISSVLSNNDGVFSFEASSGFYDVCVFSPGFTAKCRKIEVPSSAALKIIFVLRADPLIARKRGDILLKVSVSRACSPARVQTIRC